MDKETTDKALEATKAVAEFGTAAVGAITGVGKVVLEPFVPLFGALTDRANAVRYRNAIRIAQKTEAFARENGLFAPTRELPLSFSVPLLNRATLEDDDELQTLWAKLIANAADVSTEMELRTAYVSMLGEMSAFDARNLAALVKASLASTERDGMPLIETWGLPQKAKEHTRSSEQLPPLPDNVHLSIANLIRLGCVTPIIGFGGGSLYNVVSVTMLGRAFYLALS